MIELLPRLDNVYRFHRHVELYMRITECSFEEAERALSSSEGPRLYRKMLREHCVSGGTLKDLESSGTATAQ